MARHRHRSTTPSDVPPPSPPSKEDDEEAKSDKDNKDSDDDSDPPKIEDLDEPTFNDEGKIIGPPTNPKPTKLATKEPTPKGINPFDRNFDVYTSQGSRMFDKGCKPLATPYVGGSNASHLANFKTDIKAHMTVCRLISIMEIKVGEDVLGNPITKNLLDNPRVITLDQVLDMTHAREAPPTTAAKNRQMLNAAMLFHFLWGSIGGALKTNVQVNFANRTIGEDGPALYKLIIEHVQGVATAATVRLNQENLRKITLSAYNNNVRSMHHAVHEIHLTLKANDAVPEDMQHILLNAYKRCPNQEFQQFANRLADSIDDGITCTIPALMAKAEAKYDVLYAENKWNASDGAAEILALHAEFNKYKKKYEDSRGNNKPKGQTPKKKTPKMPVPDEDLPTWKKTPPTNTDSPYKMVSVPDKTGAMVNLMHWWCQIHRNNQGMWCTHDPKECIMTKRATEQGKRTPKGPPAGKRDNKRGRTAHPNAKPHLVSNNVSFTSESSPKEPSYTRHYDSDDATSTQSYMGTGKSE